MDGTSKNQEKALKTKKEREKNSKWDRWIPKSGRVFFGRKASMSANTLFSFAFVTLLSALLCWGCNNNKKTAQPRPAGETEDVGGGESSGHGLGEENKGAEEGGGEEVEEELKVEGLLGTIDEQAVAKAFSKKSYEIEQCILGNVKAMPYVMGKMDLHFDVASNGDVTVKILENTIGNYKVEECLFKIASSLHFGKPKGGKAKVGYPLSIPHRGTPHEKWGKSKVRKEMRSNRRAIKKCKKGGKPRSFSLHFYVLPGGRMVSLGVHADNGVPPGFAACVFDALKNVTFPDTFGKVAKVKYDF